MHHSIMWCIHAQYLYFSWSSASVRFFVIVLSQYDLFYLFDLVQFLWPMTVHYVCNLLCCIYRIRFDIAYSPCVVFNLFVHHFSWSIAFTNVLMCSKIRVIIKCHYFFCNIAVWWNLALSNQEILIQINVEPEDCFFLSKSAFNFALRIWHCIIVLSSIVYFLTNLIFQFSPVCEYDSIQGIWANAAQLCGFAD